MEQDNANKNQDDASAELGSGDTSGGKKQTSAKAKGKAYSPEEIRKLQSDATASKGRELVQANAEIARLKKEGEAVITRLDEIERTQTASAYEEARKDPSGNALRSIQADEAVRTREKKATERENEATRREAQLKADRELFATESGETMVSVIAAKHGVDEKRLADLGITDKTSLDKVAADMKANTPEAKPLTAEQEAAKKEAEEKGETFSPVDETSSGAKPVDLSVESIEKASMESLEQAIAPAIK